MSKVPYKPTVCLVTPALADANNGNWQTARRWTNMLAAKYTVRLLSKWDGEPADMLIALHAKKSAESIDAWSQRYPARPLVLIMTGTDLYRDIAVDSIAQRSLAQAHQIIVLQELGGLALPAAVRHKAVVCFQSAPTRRARVKTTHHLRALMVGHLREEKSPQTFFAAARLLTPHQEIFFDHVGAPLDPALGAQAQRLQDECPHYRWLGSQTHAATRERIARAHVLVQPSRLEGGAHVVLEAVTSGTPVLASRVDGNVGMLGADYAGYFDWNDVTALAQLLKRCHKDGNFLTQLSKQCAERAFLFAPEREQSTLRNIVAELLQDMKSHFA
ncbi:MAG: TIGR04348 family glycosyltransferase [Rhodocyclaceae bacterium]|nr:TIGR04348 family glycosyltransferase [Rhodocyclaceae bacterium]